MFSVSIHRLSVLTVMRAAGCAAFVLASPAWAGDPITFSNPKDQADLPSKNLKLDQDNSKPFDFLQRKPSGAGGPGPSELTPSLAPSALRGRERRDMERYLDRQRNWIFLTPDNLKSTATPQEAFGVDDASLTSQDQHPKKLIEQYWENSGRDSQSKSNRVSDSSRRTDGALSDIDNLDADAAGANKGAAPSASASASSTRAGERGLNPLLD
ncbi:MAG: hypothetical protein KGS61_17915, partial [Verrucomicrobia bacterium]|nr:hypothetical protein [Verrucomicrobiota bacterium]